MRIEFPGKSKPVTIHQKNLRSSNKKRKKNDANLFFLPSTKVNKEKFAFLISSLVTNLFFVVASTRGKKTIDNKFNSFSFFFASFTSLISFV